MLTKLADGLWVGQRPLKLFGAELGTRMTVMRLSDGGLAVHSAVRLDDATRAAVEALGPVRDVIAPNRYHHLFVGEWITAYPEARAWAAPGLAHKRPDLAFAGTLGAEPPDGWGDTLDHEVIEGAPALGEVVFLHRPTGTLLLTDLAMSPGRGRTLYERMLFGVLGLGPFGPSRTVRFLIKDRSAFAASIQRILSWDFDRITLPHGAVIDTGGRAAFEAAFRRWIDE